MTATTRAASKPAGLLDGVALHVAPDLTLAQTGLLQLADLSPSGCRLGQEGSVAVAIDPTLGACMQIFGGRVNASFPEGTSAPSGNEARSIVAWVRYDGAGDVVLAATGGTEGQPFNLVASPTAGVSTGGKGLAASSEQLANDGQWHQVGCAWDPQAGLLTTYVDGVACKKPAKLSNGLNTAKSSEVYVGAGAGEGKRGGCIVGPVRVYTRALTPEEMAALMALDGPAGATFKASHPLDFRLQDVNRQAAIYATDGDAGQDLYLRLTNVSPHAITCDDNPRLDLVFQPGTLALGCWKGKRCITLGDPKSKWTLEIDEQNCALGLIPGKDTKLLPGVSAPLVLKNVAADAAGGSRGTRVMLRYQGLTVDQRPLSGYREQLLNVVMHKGRPDLPVHVGFVGSNTVLNDGKLPPKPAGGPQPNVLTLRMTNLQNSDDYPDLAFADDTRFILRFDVADGLGGDEWALIGKDKTGTLDVDWRCGDAAWSPTGYKPKTKGQQQIDITPGKVTLGPGDHIDFRVSGIVSDPPTGPANVYLDYQNVPGYWDGGFVLVAQKGPLVTRGEKVGVGTSEPGSSLSVNGNLSIGALADYHAAAAPASGLLVQGKVGIYTTTVTNPLTVGGGASIGQAYTGLSAPSNGLSVQGSVGIGTHEPRSALSVAGGVIVGESWVEQNYAAPSNGLCVEGVVGIMRKQPRRALQVGSDIGGIGLDCEPAQLRFGDGTGHGLYIGRGQQTKTEGVFMTILDTGRVGIGTLAPQTELDVAGTVTADQLTLGRTTIKENELQVLSDLANSKLVVLLATAGFADNSGKLLPVTPERSYLLTSEGAYDASTVAARFVWEPGISFRQKMTLLIAPEDQG